MNREIQARKQQIENTNRTIEKMKIQFGQLKSENTRRENTTREIQIGKTQIGKYDLGD